MNFPDITRINYIGVGNNQFVLNLNSAEGETKAFLKNLDLVCNIDTFDDKFDKDDRLGNNVTANKTKLNNENDSMLVHNLYYVKDLCIKSSNIENFYSPDIHHLINFITKENHIFGITYGSQNLCYNLQVHSNYDGTYSFSYNPLKEETYLYDSPEIEKENMIDYFEPKHSLGNMQYNYIYDIPITVKGDFNNGDIKGDCIYCKNLYNDNYSIEMPNQYTINNVRVYTGIGICSNNIFLKYYNNKTLVNSNLVDNNDKFLYQKIESLDSTNKFKLLDTAHKSNIYSIKLEDTGINKLVEHEQDMNDPIVNNLYNKIKLDITNNIRDITKKICPVNTELLNVYFVGE